MPFLEGKIQLAMPFLAVKNPLDIKNCQIAGLLGQLDLVIRLN